MPGRDDPARLSRACGPDAGGTAPLERREDLGLAAAGWQRRHTTDAARAAESIALYEALGFEVTTHALARRDFAAGCAACADVACQSQVLIYTRSRR